ncbi:MAG: radical SAM protein, partial [Clostridiales Family XIII bacterium]|nr:radical SAM protein [Clostridiales Family XIII bacterium]
MMSGVFKEHIGSDELFGRIKEDLALCITMEITHRCNYKCVHCYGDFERTERDIGYEQLTGMIDQFSEHGTLDVSLTGGEPLARPDFCDLYVYTRKKGIFVSVLT